MAYEYVLTVHDEWAFLRKRRWTGTSWLFIANRASMLLTIVDHLAPYTEQVCDAILRDNICTLTNYGYRRTDTRRATCEQRRSELRAGVPALQLLP